jgi:hypothetical protein
MGIIADLCNFEEDVAEILSGVDVIKLFLSGIYEFSYLARVFVPGKTFQPSVMFTVKGQSLHRWSTFQVPYSWVNCCKDQQTLD